MGICKIGLQWSINRKIPSSERFKSRRGCGFQTQGLDSVDDNERWDSLGLDSVKMLACMLETCKIGLQWSINRNVPSSERFKSRRGCGFQTQGLDLVDDNESWYCVGFCRNACMHVWRYVKLGCNRVL